MNIFHMVLELWSGVFLYHGQTGCSDEIWFWSYGPYTIFFFFFFVLAETDILMKCVSCDFLCGQTDGYVTLFYVTCHIK